MTIEKLRQKKLENRIKLEIEETLNSIKHIDFEGQIKETLKFLQEIIEGGEDFTIGHLEELYKRHDKILEPIGKNSACVAGCSFCCYQAVNIYEIEVDYLEKVLGIIPNRDAIFDYKEETLHEKVRKYKTKPCVFLKEGKCSIYENRPIVCRSHFNISKTPEICNTFTKSNVKIPNLRPADRVGDFISWISNNKLGEIREVFTLSD